MSSSYSMTVNYEGFICYSDGSSPSLPKSFPPSWAPDGEEPSPHSSTHISTIVRVTSSIERAWIPPSSPRSGEGTRWLIRHGGNRRDWFPRGPGAEGGVQAAQRL